MNGEWIQIELPYFIKLTSVIIRPMQVSYGINRTPKSGVILGSNDGNTWVLIHNYSSGTLSGNGPFTYNISSFFTISITH